MLVYPQAIKFYNKLQQLKYTVYIKYYLLQICLKKIIKSADEIESKSRDFIGFASAIFRFYLRLGARRGLF